MAYFYRFPDWGNIDYVIYFPITVTSWGQYYKQFPVASQGALVVKNMPAHAGFPKDADSQSRSPGPGDPLEEEMAPYSSILAWKIPWAEEHGKLQSRMSQRVGHNWMTEHT